MNRDVLVSALAAVFAGLAVTVVIVGVATEPFVAVLAVPFGVVAYVMWYQASGRLGRRIYRSVEQAGRVDPEARQSSGRSGSRRSRRERGGFGAGPRDDWEPQGAWARRVREERRQERARTGEKARTGAGSGAHAASGGRRAQRGRGGGRTGPSRREAYDVLGVEPGADQAAIRRAYRERVKAVHPDAKTGDEAEFKRVTAAYERLTD